MSWRHPTRNLQIYLRAESVQLLAERSLRRLKASPPSELGGLLWGKLVPSEHNASALFLFPELVSAESALFNRTEGDFRSLTAALEHPPQEGLQVLGFFRSHAREGLCLSAQDKAFAEQFVRNPDSAFLIIRPFEIGICMAGFFFWDHDHLQTDVSDLEVPFVAPEDRSYSQGPVESELATASADPGPSRTAIPAGPLASAPPPKPSPNNRATPSAMPSSFRRPPRPKQAPFPERSPARVRPDTRRRYSWQIVLSCVLFLLICFGAYFLAARPGLRLGSSASASPKTEVGLQVKADSNGQLDLSWDQTSPALQKAQGATLTITDGTLHRELNIDQSQLRFGKLAYFPNSDDVQFYLEVHLDAVHSIAESVRVLPRIGGSSKVVQSTSEGSAGGPTESGLRLNGNRATVLGERRTPSAPQNSGSQSIQPARETAKNFSMVFSAISLPSAPHTVSGPFAPPPALDSQSGVDDLTANVKGVPISLPSAPPQAKASVPAMPATSSLSAGPAYVPARPLKQVLPVASIDASSRVYQVTSVTVQTEINEKGRVTAAHVVRGAPGANTALTAQAVLAAKQWTFRPATLHGKNVPSDHIIVFRFRPAE